MTVMGMATAIKMGFATQMMIRVPATLKICSKQFVALRGIVMSIWSMSLENLFKTRPTAANNVH